MDWLVPAILASLTGSVVIAAVFGYLAVTEREHYLRVWTAAWVLYAVRLLFDLASALDPSAAAWAGVLAAASAIAHSMLILAGTARFLGRKPRDTLLLVTGSVAFAVTVVAHLLGLAPSVADAPAYLVQGVAQVLTGIAWWRSGVDAGRWARLTAAAFIVWGVHKLDYPFLRGVEAVAPAGFMLGAVLSLVVSLGVLVAYFERMRRLLSASEARYRALFQDSATVMLIIDPETRTVVDANHAAERFYGWSREELLRKRISDINTLSPEQIDHEMADARAGNRHFFRFRHRLASGEIRDVEVFSGSVPGPRHELLYSIVHDVTKRVTAERALAESEERYRTLFDQSEQPMMLIEPDGARIREANEAAAAFYGYPVDRLVAMTIGDLTDDPPEEIESEVAATVGGRRQVGVYRHRLADGSYRDVEIHATPLRFGDRTQLYTIVHDVTKRVDAERALARHQRDLEGLVEARTADLREAMERLAAATAAKDDFLASMSHELRTPLNSVIGFAHLLGQELPGPLNEEQHRQVGMIERSGQHLLALVSQVLDLARIEAGQVDIEYATVDGSEIAAHVVESLRGPALDGDLELVLEASQPVELETDPHILEQILWNLVGNAVKYTAQGEVRLHVTPGAQEARFAVSDTGPGLSQDQLARAFDRFSRFHLYSDIGGTGLGLNIALRLAEQLGGRIEAESVEGAGSTFSLVLPLRPTV